MKRVVQNIRRVFAYIILYVRYRQTLVGRQQPSSRSKIAMVRTEMEKKAGRRSWNWLPRRTFFDSISPRTVWVRRVLTRKSEQGPCRGYCEEKRARFSDRYDVVVEMETRLRPDAVPSTRVLIRTMEARAFSFVAC